MVTFFGEEQGVKEFLMWVEDLSQEPTKEDLMDWETRNLEFDAKWINAQLYTVLSLNLVDNALAHIKSLYEDIETNGATGWWKLTQEFSGVTAQRVQGLAERI